MRSLVRTLLSVTAMIVVYYLAPLDRAVDPELAVSLGAGLVVLGAAVGWQARAIAVSPTPRLRAAETVALALPALLVLFASVYVVISHQNPANFTEPLGRVAALYFTITVFATVGFGDIAPVTDVARIITMVQMVVGLTVFGVVARLLLGAVQRAVSTKEAATKEAATKEAATTETATTEAAPRGSAPPGDTGGADPSSRAPSDQPPRQR